MADHDNSTGHLSQTAPDETPGKQEDPKQELENAIKGSHQVLVSATTVFPLTIFPDTLIVDRAKLTITRRSFFDVAEVMSIRIEDVLNVTAQVGPLFGSVKITSRIFNIEKPYRVNYFWREDALKIKRITQGYIIALQKEIDCSALSTRELAAMLDELGKDDHHGQVT